MIPTQSNPLPNGPIGPGWFNLSDWLLNGDWNVIWWGDMGSPRGKILGITADNLPVALSIELTTTPGAVYDISLDAATWWWDGSDIVQDFASLSAVTDGITSANWQLSRPAARGTSTDWQTLRGQFTAEDSSTTFILVMDPAAPSPDVDIDDVRIDLHSDSVPDSGASILLLGASLTGLSLLRRRR